MMGRGQVVRQRFLVPSIVGSNPTAPASYYKLRTAVYMDLTAGERTVQFFEKYPVRNYKKGQILIHAGDDPDGIMYLVSGKIKQYDLTYRGDEVILNVFKPPAFFPMSFAMNQTPNEYFYEADSEVELRKAPIPEITAFIRANPDVLYDLLSRVYRGTDGLLRRIAHLMASSARSRVVYELMIESRRFGQTSDKGIIINLNETDIAARAGLSRETVNREMHKLKAEDLIHIDNKQISVPNLELLGKILSDEHTAL